MGAGHVIDGVFSANLANRRRNERTVSLKAEAGKTIVILGSADLAATLTRHGLIDEYHVAVNPVVLGGGRALFKGGDDRLDLRLLGARTFASGIVEVCYAPERGA